MREALKAEEYRNIWLFFFPIMLEQLTDKLARKVWARLAFLMRAYYFPDREYAGLGKQYLKDMGSALLKSWIEAFGEANCTYNVHHVLHLPTTREAGQFTDISAVPYESSFANVRRSFVAGTPDIPKQILETMYMRLLKGQSCTKKVRKTWQARSQLAISSLILYECIHC